MPIAPEGVTESGRYSLDEGRFLEVMEGANGLEYWEGRTEVVQPESASPKLVASTARKIPTVRLEAGWRIEFTPPDRISIDPGTAQLVERGFGEGEGEPAE